MPTSKPQLPHAGSSLALLPSWGAWDTVSHHSVPQFPDIGKMGMITAKGLWGGLWWQLWLGQLRRTAMFVIGATGEGPSQKTGPPVHGQARGKAHGVQKHF